MRKNPFDQDRSNQAVPTPGVPGSPAGQQDSALTPFDMMGAQPKSRNRDFEKKNRAYSYLLQDKELGPRVAAVAQSLQVTVDEVARAFVEAGIQAAHQEKIPFGDLPPQNRRMTLYPTGNEKWSIQEEKGWAKEIPVRADRKKPMSEAEKQKRRKELNQYVAAYRWPADVDDALTKLTEEVAGKALTRSDGRKGWVLTILLRYALATYEAGALPLQPQPKVVKMELTW